MSTSEFSLKGRTLIEEQAFTKAVEELGGAKAIDMALLSLCGPLDRRPEKFPKIPGHKDLRIAKTKEMDVEGKTIPALRIWFRILGDGNISLLYIEEIPQD